MRHHPHSKLVIFFLLCLFLLSSFCKGNGEAENEDDLDLIPAPALPKCNTPGPFPNESSLAKNSITACPLGFYCNETGKCECLGSPADQIVSCTTIPYLKFSALDCHCATYNGDHVEAGSCIYNCENHRVGNSTDAKDLNDVVYHKFKNESSSLNNPMCSSFNRAGALCGECKPNYYPLAYSFFLNCVKCPHVVRNWFLYIVGAYIPLTFFYVFVLFFKVNAVSSHLHPVIFYSQLISIPALSRIVFLAMQYRPKTFIGVKLVLSFYGIWNLDFFRPFYSNLCLGIGVLPNLALEYVIALYPLLLIGLSYLLIVLYDRNYRFVTLMFSPFRSLSSKFKRGWDIRTSVIDVFATFFLLSNVKVLAVSFDLLAPAQVNHLYPSHHNYTFSLYYAGNIEYFGKEHLPYAIIAIFLLMIFVLFPVLILALYPFQFFHKFLNLFPFRWYILHTFVDAFHGCYKDGTQPGTRDCRWFAALYFAFRFLLCFLYSVTLNAVYFQLCSLFVLLLVMLIIVIQPYKPQMASHAKTNAVFFIMYAMLLSCISGGDTSGTKAHNFVGFFYTLSMAMSLVPLVCMLGFLCYWAFSRWGFAMQYIRGLYKGYKFVGSVVDEECEEYSDRVVNPQNYPVLPAVPKPAELAPGSIPTVSLHSSPLRDCSVLKD